MRTRVCGLITAAAVLVLSVGVVWAQNAIELQLDDQPLGEAMRSLQQAYGVQYNLPADLARTKVTVHQTVNSPAAAVQALARAANVRALQDPNTGAFVFQAQGAAGTGTGGGTSFGTGTTRNPWATTPTGAAPTPWRPGGATVPAAPGAGGTGMPGAPGAAGAGAAPGTFVTQYGTTLNIKDLVLRVLETTYINPELVALLYGGGAIYDISGMSGGGYGGGGYGGGYGNTGGYGSNSGIGSGFGNRSSNTGSGLSSGLSSRSSGLGSSRSSRTY